MYTSFKIEIDQGVARMRFERPESFNSMTTEFWGELPRAMEELNQSGQVRALVLSGEGKHFCAGMDLSVFATHRPNDGQKFDNQRLLEATAPRLSKLQDTISSMEDARFPVISAVQGGCIGGGVDLITSCDIRYATKNAFICIQETNIGLAADVGTLQRIGKVMPQGLARELAYTGRRMKAEEGFATGFFTSLHDTHEECVAAALETAHTIASKSPITVRMTKEYLNYSRDHSVEESLKYQAITQNAFLSVTDMQEALTAMQEKRVGNFADLAPLSKALGE